MKLTYKYIGEGFTMVRLDENSTVVTKVKKGQTVESDRDPKYFLEAQFEAVDLRTTDDIEYAKKRLEAEKILEEIKDMEISKSTEVAIDIASMSIEELREKLTEMGIRFNANCSKSTLARKLSEAMYAS